MVSFLLPCPHRVRPEAAGPRTWISPPESWKAASAGPYGSSRTAGRVPGTAASMNLQGRRREFGHQTLVRQTGRREAEKTRSEPLVQERVLVTSTTIFHREIRDHGVGLGQPGTRVIEATSLRHEVGHALRLVNNGFADARRRRGSGRPPRRGAVSSAATSVHDVRKGSPPPPTHLIRSPRMRLCVTVSKLSCLPTWYDHGILAV